MNHEPIAVVRRAIGPPPLALRLAAVLVVPLLLYALVATGQKALDNYRLNQEVVHILNQADVKEKFFSIGVDTVGSSPEEFTAKMKSEIARMSKVIKEAGIKAD